MFFSFRETTCPRRIRPCPASAGRSRSRHSWICRPRRWKKAKWRFPHTVSPFLIKKIAYLKQGTTFPVLTGSSLKSTSPSSPVPPPRLRPWRHPRKKEEPPLSPPPKAMSGWPPKKTLEVRLRRPSSICKIKSKKNFNCLKSFVLLTTCLLPSLSRSSCCGSHPLSLNKLKKIWVFSVQFLHAGCRSKKCESCCCCCFILGFINSFRGGVPSYSPF